MTDAFVRHNDEQQAYFEQRVPRTMVPSSTPYVRRQVEVLVRETGLKKGDRVLEVGCGMGRYTFSLLERGLDVEGLDLSRVLLDRLRAYGGDGFSIPLHAADVVDPPPALVSRFDAIVGFFTLHHLHDLGASYRSMTTLVRPGGVIAFVEPNPYNPLYYVQIAVTPGMKWRGERGLVRLRRSVLAGTIEHAGLTSLEIHPFGFMPPFAANRAAGHRAERTLESIPLLRPVSAFQLIVARRR